MNKGVKNPSYRHGKSGTPIHARWKSMLDRCRNNKSRVYKYYGGRGIRVCRRWHDFALFYKDMGDPPFKGAMLDRINNNGPYSKSNCRWVTKSQSAANQRRRRGRYMRGVYLWRKHYHSKISINDKDVHLGKFKTEMEAHEAYREKHYEVHGFYPPRDYLPSRLGKS